jgi:hypothetical protein
LGGGVELDKLSIDIRPRRPWEAVDLGFLMAKRWWWLLTKVWLACSLPIFLVLAFLPKDYLWLQLLIVWWLKPLYERPLLFALSRLVFGEQVSSSEVIKRAPGLMLRRAFLAITFRRLSPSRSTDAPVQQLEGLTSHERSRRLSLLHRQGLAPSMLITFVSIFIEALIWLGMVVLVWAFVPQHIEFELEKLLFERDYYVVEMLNNVLCYLAMMLVAPFYVAGGFALYLNRRIHLEAWDIEIQFRQMLERRSKAKTWASRLSSPIIAVLLAFAVAVPWPNTAVAAENEDSPEQEYVFVDHPSELDHETAKVLINKIEQGEDFHRKEIVRTLDLDWDKKKEEEEEPEEEVDFDGFWEGMKSVIGWFATSAEILLWVVVLSLILFIVFRYRHWFMDALAGDDKDQAKAHRPDILMGMDLRAESMPDDIGAEAERLLQEGHVREACALLYRASLKAIMDRGVELESSFTELECLRAAHKHRNTSLAQNSFSYLQSLTRVWRNLAYGHVNPSQSEMLELCQTWAPSWQGGELDG